MPRLFRTSFCMMLMSYALTLHAQNATAVQFNINQQRINDSIVDLRIKAIVPPSTKLYALQKSPDDALYSSITFDSSIQVKLIDSVTEQANIQTEKDAGTSGKAMFVTDSIVWQQKIKAYASDSFTVKAAISFLYNKANDYVAGDTTIKVYIQPSINIAQSSTQINATGVTTDKSAWWIFFTAFAGGLLALLTPCVYSMIPITVSFFTKRSQTRKEGIKNALSYSASIVIIFTIFGFLITLIFGPAALNNLATNWIANLLFFIIFLLFGISFLGGFEITLPAALSTKADSKAGVKNFSGIFFMALTLVLVSFSCTGPIIGNLLVLAAKGNFYGPLIGMFGFSLALALPFALFAFFPSKLHVLGKAGGWLNAIKVTLGFLELALAMKFLSNADLSKSWRLLDREIFLAIWIAIFLALGFYLFGLLKFRHDDDLPVNDFGKPHLSITRLFFALASFAFVFYMIPGLFGAPLKGISAFLPPMGTQDFTGSTVFETSSSNNNNNINSLPPAIKYTAQMKMYEPAVVRKFGMTIYYDYDEALKVAKQFHKPLMLDFTGINCVNCRKMEAQVWSNADVMQRLKNNFVIVSLYVDVHNIELQPSEQFYSKVLDKQVETLGDKNADMQVTHYAANTQPYYFFIDNNEKKLVDDGYGYDPEINKFTNLLDSVTAAYNRAMH